MKIKDIMTHPAEWISPEMSLSAAADLMRKSEIGFLPIGENDRLIGSVTDRDIVIRGVAEGREMEGTPVRAIMSPKIVYIFDDQDVEEAVRLMEVRQIRRLAVLNREKRLVGIISLGDLAGGVGTNLSGEALREICEPIHSNSDH
jgi:CBS domain-containing protein